MWNKLKNAVHKAKRAAKGAPKRVTALVLCASMMLSLVPYIAPAWAAEGDGTDKGTYNPVSLKDLYVREADKNTMDAYIQASLGGLIYLQETSEISGYDDEGNPIYTIDGVSTATTRNNFGTRFAGEIWADKSVFALYQEVVAEIRPFETGHVYDISRTNFKSIYEPDGNNGWKLNEKNTADEVTRVLTTLHYWLLPNTAVTFKITKDSKGNISKDANGNVVYTVGDDSASRGTDYKKLWEALGFVIDDTEVIDGINAISDERALVEKLITGSLTSTQADALNAAINDRVAAWAKNLDGNIHYSYNHDGDFNGTRLILGCDTDGVTSYVDLPETSDFLHVFSVLGSSKVVNDAMAAALDVVIIMDASGSLNDDSEAYYTTGVEGETYTTNYYEYVDADGKTVRVDLKEKHENANSRLEFAAEALNEVFGTLMSANSYNRVALLTYNGPPNSQSRNGSIQGVEEILSLGRYEPTLVKRGDDESQGYYDGATRYFTIAQNGDSDTRFKNVKSDYGGWNIVEINARPDNESGLPGKMMASYTGSDGTVHNFGADNVTGEKNYFIGTGAHTETQMGIVKAMQQILGEEKDTTVKLKNENGQLVMADDGDIEITRRPVVILITDGRINTYSNYNDWWTVGANGTMTEEAAGSNLLNIYGNMPLYIATTASLWKKIVNTNYYGNPEGDAEKKLDTLFYTFGLALNDTIEMNSGLWTGLSEADAKMDFNAYFRGSKDDNGKTIIEGKFKELGDALTKLEATLGDLDTAVGSLSDVSLDNTNRSYITTLIKEIKAYYTVPDDENKNLASGTLTLADREKIDELASMVLIRNGTRDGTRGGKGNLNRSVRFLIQDLNKQIAALTVNDSNRAAIEGIKTIIESIVGTTDEDGKAKSDGLIDEIAEIAERMEAKVSYDAAKAYVDYLNGNNSNTNWRTYLSETILNNIPSGTIQLSSKETTWGDFAKLYGKNLKEGQTVPSDEKTEGTLTKTLNLSSGELKATFTYGDESTEIEVTMPSFGAAAYRPGSVADLNFADEFNNVVNPQDLPDILASAIQGIIDGTPYQPITGVNSAGSQNAVTYSDPIGDYMNVDDVTDLTLFGEHYKVEKWAVYDYAANTEILKRGFSRQIVLNSEDSKDPDLPESEYQNVILDGWYDAENNYYGDDGQGKFRGTPINGAKTSFPKAGDVTVDVNNAWEHGYTYRVSFYAAKNYISTFTGNAYGELTAKEQNTTYTLYQITGRYETEGTGKDRKVVKTTIDKNGKEVEALTKITSENSTIWNLSFGASKAEYDKLTTDDERKAYADQYQINLLTDIKIWVEDTGEYRDSAVGDYIVDNGYSEALYVDIAAKAIPVQIATVSLQGGVNATDYETNLENVVASTPLRVFYDVSMDTNYLRYMAGAAAGEKKNAVGVALSAISAEYLNKNTGYYTNNTKDHFYDKVSSPDGASRMVAFYSNYFTNSTYDDFVVMSDPNKSSRGNAAVSFAPNADNDFYRFQKNRTLYLIPGSYGLETRPAEIDLGDLSTNSGVKYYVQYKIEQEDREDKEGAVAERTGLIAAVPLENGVFTAPKEETKTDETNGITYRYYFEALNPDNFDHLLTLLNAYRANMDWSGAPTSALNGSISNNGFPGNADTPASRKSPYWYFGDCMYVDEGMITSDELRDTIAVRDPKRENAELYQNQFWAALARDGYIQNWDGKTDPSSYKYDKINANNWYYIIREYYYPVYKQEQAKNEAGNLLYEDKDGKRLYEVKAEDGTSSFFDEKGKKQENVTDDALKPVYETVLDHVETHYLALARKGDELGSGVGSQQNEFVDWYDKETGTVYEGFDSRDKDNQFGKPTQDKNGNTITNPLYLAARVGGLRVGSMANFAGVKNYDVREGVDEGRYETDASKGGRIDQANVTGTSLTYFLPTISTYTNPNSPNGVSVVVNAYLGNNGRILVDDAIMIVTKTVNTISGGTGLEAQTELFTFQIEIEGFYGERGAVIITRDEFAPELWRRRYDTIDVLTDNRDLLLGDDGNIAMVDSSGQRVVKMEIVELDANGYVKADDNTTTNPGPQYAYFLAKKDDDTGEVIKYAPTRTVETGEKDSDNKPILEEQEAEKLKVTFKDGKWQLVSVSDYDKADVLTETRTGSTVTDFKETWPTDSVNGVVLPDLDQPVGENASGKNTDGKDLVYYVYVGTNLRSGLYNDNTLRVFKADVKQDGNGHVLQDKDGALTGLGDIYGNQSLRGGRTYYLTAEQYDGLSDTVKANGLVVIDKDDTDENKFSPAEKNLLNAIAKELMGEDYDEGKPYGGYAGDGVGDRFVFHIIATKGSASGYQPGDREFWINKAYLIPVTEVDDMDAEYEATKNTNEPADSWSWGHDYNKNGAFDEIVKGINDKTIPLKPVIKGTFGFFENRYGINFSPDTSDPDEYINDGDWRTGYTTETEDLWIIGDPSVTGYVENGVSKNVSKYGEHSDYKLLPQFNVAHIRPSDDLGATSATELASNNGFYLESSFLTTALDFKPCDDLTHSHNVGYKVGENGEFVLDAQGNRIKDEEKGFEYGVATFTLKDGQGLGFNNIDNGANYVVTEVLSPKQVDQGVRFQQVDHVQGANSRTRYEYKKLSAGTGSGQTGNDPAATDPVETEAVEATAEPTVEPTAEPADEPTVTNPPATGGTGRSQNFTTEDKDAPNYAGLKSANTENGHAHHSAFDYDKETGKGLGENVYIYESYETYTKAEVVGGAHDHIWPEGSGYPLNEDGFYVRDDGTHYDKIDENGILHHYYWNGGKRTDAVKPIDVTANFSVENRYTIVGSTSPYEEGVHFVNFLPDIVKLEFNPGLSGNLTYDRGDGVFVGDVITYAVRWENYEYSTQYSSSMEAKVVIRDELDPGVDFVSAVFNPTHGSMINDDGSNYFNQEDYLDKYHRLIELEETIRRNNLDENNLGGYEWADEYSKLKRDWRDNDVKLTADGPTDAEGNLRLTATYTADGTGAGTGNIGVYGVGSLTPEREGEAPKMTVTIRFIPKNEEHENIVEWTIENAPADTYGYVELQVKVNNTAVADWDYDGNYQEGESDERVVNRAGVKVGNNPERFTNTIENPTGSPHKTEIDPGDGSQVTVGQKVEYSVEWTNTESKPAKITIEDRLDPGVWFYRAWITGQKFEHLKPGEAKDSEIVQIVPSDGKQVNDEGKEIPAGSYEKYGGEFKEPEPQQPEEPNGTGGSGSRDSMKLRPAQDPEQLASRVAQLYAHAADVNELPANDGEEQSVGTPSGALKIDKMEAVAEFTGKFKAITGDQIEYTIDWSRVGFAPEDEDITSVKVIVALDKGVDVDEDAVEAAGGDYDGKTHTVTWTVEEDAETGWPESGTVTLTVKVNSSAHDNGKNNEVVSEAWVEVETEKKEPKTDENGEAVKDENEEPVTETVKTKYVSEKKGTAATELEPKPGKTVNTITKVTTDAEGKETGRTENKNPADTDVVEPGDEITYEIIWTNYARDEARTGYTNADVTITDYLDPGVDFVEAWIEDGTGNKVLTVDRATLRDTSGDSKNQIAYAPNTHSVVWTMNGQPAEAKDTYRVFVTVKVNDNATKDYSYNTEGQLVGGTGVDNKVVNMAKVALSVQAEGKTVFEHNQFAEAKATTARTKPTMSSNYKEAAVGWEITYNIRWTDFTDGTVTIKDVLDASKGLTFVEAGILSKNLPNPTVSYSYNESTKTLVVTWTYEDNSTIVVTLEGYDDGKGGTYTDGAPIVYSEWKTATVTWNLENVPEGGEVYLTAKVSDKAKDKGAVTNEADVTVDGGDKQTVTATTAIKELETVYGTGYHYGENEEPLRTEGTVTMYDEKDEPYLVGVVITYDPETHVITWELTNVPGLYSGRVYFSVIVNQYANYEWDSDGVKQEGDTKEAIPGDDGTYDWPATGKYPEPEVDEGKEDYEILNRARMRVEDKSWQYTNIIENPTKPKKEEVTPGNGKNVSVGEVLTYTVTWKNNASDQNGTPKAATVVVRDWLDPGVDFVEAGIVSGGVYSPFTSSTTTYKVEVSDKDENGKVLVTWDLGERGAGTSGEVYLRVRVTERAEKKWYYNTTDGTLVPEEDIKENSGDWVFNMAIVEVDHNPEYTNVVENRVDPGPEKTEPYPGNNVQVNVGDIITYQITWKNDAFLNRRYVPATVTIYDKLDPGVDFVEAGFGEVDGNGNPKEDQGKYADCDAIYALDPEDPHVVTWTLPNRDPGARGAVWLKVRVNENARTSYQYNDGAYKDPNPEVEDSWGFTGGAGTDYMVYNQALVDVENGSHQKTDIVQNPLPNPQTPQPGTPHKTEVTPGNGVGVEVGEQIAYRIRWQNDAVRGTANIAAKVTIIDKLDPGVDFVKASFGDVTLEAAGAAGNVITETGSDGRGAITIEYDKDSHTVTWVLERRAARATGDVDLVVQVNEDAYTGYEYNKKQGNYTNAWNNDDDWADGWYLDGPEEKDDWEVENQALVVVENGSKQLTEIPKNPLKPGKTETDPGDGKSVVVGQEIDYKITWFNNAKDRNGRFTASTVTIIDKLDPGVDYVAAGFTGDDGNSWDGCTVSYDKAAHTVTWTMPKRAAEANGAVWLKVTVNEKAELRYEYDGDDGADWFVVRRDGNDDMVYNQAWVRVANGTDLLTNIVENPTGPGKTETDPGDGKAVKVGQDITYEVTWINDAVDKETGKPAASTVTVIDKLDPGVDYVSAGFRGTDGNNWTGCTVSYDKATHTVTWTMPKRAAEASGTVWLTVKVNERAYEDWHYNKERGQYELGWGIESGSGKDNKVVNQARVTVENGSDVLTNIPENPVGDPKKPGKTETDPGDGKAVKVGQDITYEVTWINDAVDKETGKPAASTVTVIDKLDPGVDYVSAGFRGTDGNNWTGCTVSYDKATHTVTWTMPKRAAEVSGTVWLTVKVNERAYEDWHYNKATGQYEPGWGIESGSGEDNKVVNQARVTVENGSDVLTNIPENPVDDPKKPGKTETDPGNGKTVVVGQEIDYRITWKNDASRDGKPVASTVTIVDKLDPGVDFVSAGFEAGGKQVAELTGCTVAYDKASHTVTWTLPERGAEAEGAVWLKVTVNEKAELRYEYDGNDGANWFIVRRDGTDGMVYNQAWVRVTNGSSQLTNIVKNPLGPEKEETDPGDGETIVVGQEIDYSITWRNDAMKDGRFVESTVTVVDKLDPGVDFVGAGFTGNDGNSWTGCSVKYDKATHTVTWTMPKRAAEAEGAVWLTVKVNERVYEDWHYNKATGQYEPGWDIVSDGGDDWKVVNQARITVENGSDVLTNIPENPLGPEKEEVTPGNGETVVVGQEIDYEITWRNDAMKDGRFVESTVTIIDKLDPGVDYVDAGFTGNDGNSWTGCTVVYDKASHTVTWTLPGRAAEATGAVWLKVKVNENARFTYDYNGKDGDDWAIEEGDGIDYKVYNQARIIVENGSDQVTNIPKNPVDHPGKPEKTETKPGNNVEVKIGQEITYEITWKNDAYDRAAGRPAAATVTIIDKLDPGVDYVDAGFTGDDGNSWAGCTVKYDKATHTVTWTMPKRAADAEGTVWLKVKVNENARVTYVYNGKDVDEGWDIEKGDGTDDMVYNQARVKVENGSDQLTEIPRNPVTPPPDIPKTGDESHLAFWVTLLGLSVTGLLASLFYTSRKLRPDSAKGKKRE